MSVLPLDAGRLPAAESDGEGDGGSVHATLVGIVQRLFRVPWTLLTPETAYADIPGWDSLSHVNVIFGVEQGFGLRFDDNELEQLRAFTTMGELEALVRMKLAAAADVRT